MKSARQLLCGPCLISEHNATAKMYFAGDDFYNGGKPEKKSRSQIAID